MRKESRALRRVIVAGLAGGALLAVGVVLVGALALRRRAASEPAPTAGAAAAATQRFAKEGVVVEFSMEHRSPSREARSSAPLMEGDFAQVRFRLTDATSGKPMRGLSPAAWMDVAQNIEGQNGERRACKDKVALYLKGIVGIRPLIDLNSYYLLVLNQDPSISVIDPLVSLNGKTSLYATVLLKRPGADWVKSRDLKKLYVSMPRAGEVAVVDAESFKVLANVEAGEEPTRVALPPDGRYLFVANDSATPAASGVTVLDTETEKVVARLPTGAGHHEIAFSSDERLAFVSSRSAGTVTAVDLALLKKVKEVPTGPMPISLGVSSLSQQLYVADGQTGEIAVIDPGRLAVAARLQSRPGLGPMRFTRDGRFGLIVNPAEHALVVVDAAVNRLVHSIPMGGEPYQVSVTQAFAYVRLLDSEQVRLVTLGSLGEGKSPTVQNLAAGSAAPRLASELSIADGISPASTEAAVFIVSPADSATFYYMEGMNAPMGSFGSYGHNARAVTLIDRSLSEVEPGVYAATARIPAAGHYDVALLLESPRLIHCFSAEVRPNPLLEREQGALAVEYVELPSKLAVGEPLRVRMRLTDPATRLPKRGLSDVRVLSYLVPGRQRSEVSAREVEEGLYEASTTPSEPGAYYYFVSARSLGVKYGDLPYRAINVVAPVSAAAQGAKP